MVQRVQVREIGNDEGNRLLGIVRRSSGSVVTWRRAHMVLLSAHAMDVPMIARVTFTSPDRVRAVLHNLNADGCDSLRLKYAGGRPPKFDMSQRAEIDWSRHANKSRDKSRAVTRDVIGYTNSSNNHVSVLKLDRPVTVPQVVEAGMREAGAR
jgi:hypothetical protein